MQTAACAAFLQILQKQLMPVQSYTHTFLQSILTGLDSRHAGQYPHTARWWSPHCGAHTTHPHPPAGTHCGALSTPHPHPRQSPTVGRTPHTPTHGSHPLGGTQHPTPPPTAVTHCGVLSTPHPHPRQAPTGGHSAPRTYTSTGSHPLWGTKQVTGRKRGTLICAGLRTFATSILGD